MLQKSQVLEFCREQQFDRSMYLFLYHPPLTPLAWQPWPVRDGEKHRGSYRHRRKTDDVRNFGELCIIISITLSFLSAQAYGYSDSNGPFPLERRR